MNNPKAPEIDQRKLIPIWIEAEKMRLEPEEPPMPRALDGETLAEIEKIFEPLIPHFRLICINGSAELCHIV